MKKFILLAIVSAFLNLGLSAQAPIPNQGFETWNGTNPANWGTSDGIFAGLGANPGNVTKETNAANVYVGNSSIKLKTDSVTIALLGQTILVPGVASLGSLTLSIFTQSLDIKGIAYADRPDSLSLAYKYTSGAGGSDTGSAIITLTKTAPGTPNGRKIIATSTIKLAPTSTYTVVTTKIDYQSLLAPDTLYIQLLSSNLGGFGGGGGGGGAGGFGGGVKGSTLWADNLLFSGLDTAFRAYISPRFNRNICQGDIVSLSGDDIQGFSYQWLKDGQPMNNETQFYYDVDQTGTYQIIVDNGVEVDTSAAVTITVNPLPVVTLSGTPTTICNNAAAITLTGGTPPGGTFSGTGVANGNFTPSSAALGNNTITYTYTDNNRCEAEATEVINVTNCSSIDEVAAGYSINVFPNPARNDFFVSADLKTIGSNINVIDASGRVVSSTKITDALTSISTNLLSSGNYILQIIDANNKPLAKGKITISK